VFVTGKAPWGGTNQGRCGVHGGIPRTGLGRHFRETSPLERE